MGPGPCPGFGITLAPFAGAAPAPAISVGLALGTLVACTLLVVVGLALLTAGVLAVAAVVASGVVAPPLAVAVDVNEVVMRPHPARKSATTNITQPNERNDSRRLID